MTTNLVFRQLTSEWNRIARTPGARRQLRQWQRTHPVLEGFDSPDELVTACRGGRDHPRPQLLAAALVELAPTDEFAARTALQAVLPGLWGLTGRVVRNIQHPVGPGRVWASVVDLEHDIVGIAAAVLRRGAARGCVCPATRVVDCVWDEIRQTIRVELRAVEQNVALEEAWAEPAPERAMSSAELVARVLVGAVECGALPQRDAALIYTTRVLGYPASDLGSTDARTVVALRRRRERGVQRLSAAVARGEVAIAC